MGVDEFGIDPDADYSRATPCADDDHAWGPWHFAHVGTHEVRFCTRCGDMEQQWIQVEGGTR